MTAPTPAASVHPLLGQAVRAIMSAGYKVRYNPQSEVVVIACPNTGMTVRTVHQYRLADDHAQILHQEARYG
jgi:hypothetical protein